MEKRLDTPLGLLTLSIERLERFALPVLLVASVTSVVLALYLSRGGFFQTDELAKVALATQSLSFSELIQPYWGHLILVPRLVYRGMLEVFGGNYLSFRILGLLMNIAVVLLLFTFMKQLTRPIIALVASTTLLFFGSDWWISLTGNAITVSGATACGIGALLAVQRGTPKWLAVSCLLIIVGVMTYSITVVFVVAVAVLILARRQYSHLWVPLVPMALLAAWRIYVSVDGLSVGLTDIGYQSMDAKNLFLWPVWSLDALAAILSSITGLTYWFSADELPRVGNPMWGGASSRRSPGDAVASGTCFEIPRKVGVTGRYWGTFSHPKRDLATRY